MPETLSVRPRICQQIRSGPLGQWIDDFVDVLTTRGYATSVVRRHVRAAAVFSAWLERQRVAATEIDEPLVARFISGLPRWGSPKRRPNRVSEVAGGVRLLAAHLWTQGVAARPCPGRRPMRDRAVAAALRRSPRASAWPGRRDPADVPALCRSASCRSAQGHRRPIGPSSPCRRSRRSCRPGPASSVSRPAAARPVPPVHFYASLPPAVWFAPASKAPCRPSANGSTPDCPAPSPMPTWRGCWPRWTRHAPTAVVTAPSCCS